MNNQQRLEQIQERLEMLKVLNDKLNKIINMMEVKSCEPMTTFVPASNKASDKFIMERQREIFSSLDNKGVE